MDPDAQASLQEARRLDREGQPGRAALAYKLVLRNDPGCLEAKVDLAGLLLQMGRFPEALDLCTEALEARPGHRGALQNLAGTLLGLERYDDAERHCRSLLQLDPRCAWACQGLGLCAAARGETLEAEAWFRKARALDPEDPEIRTALLRSLYQRRAWSEVRPLWLEVIERTMEGPLALFETAILHLTYGNLEEGWTCYESRFTPPNRAAPRLEPPVPLWDGSPFEGRTLLLHYEQGFGDTLMCIRYASLARAQGGRVVALVQPELLPVLRSCPGVDHWFTLADPVPPFDLHLPLMSLPRVFGTRLGSIPAPIPYLRAPRGASPVDGAVKASPNLKVGLVWAGNRIHTLDFLRTLPLTGLEALAGVPGVDWYGLQVGYEGGLPFEGLRDLAPRLRDFGDTARVLEQLDLLVTVDTAVAHLAGAMGLPVWLMLPLLPDWRWLLEGEDTPWYPTLRLFRQQNGNRWDDVVARIAESLNHLASERHGS